MNAVEITRMEQILSWIDNGTMTISQLVDLWEISHEEFLGNVIAQLLSE